MPVVSSELQAPEHSPLHSVKGELVKTKARPRNLLALVNKDSVDIQGGFLLNGAQLSGPKKLHSSLNTCTLRFWKGIFHLALLSHSSVFCKDAHGPPGIQGWVFLLLSLFCFFSKDEPEAAT